jgi:hypothetical protein
MSASVVEWPDIVVPVGDEAVHRHHVVHEYCAQQVLLESACAFAPDLAAPGGRRACKKSISGHRAVVRMVAQARGLVLTDKHSALIDGCDDIATLQKWSNAALTAKHPDDIFE